MNLFPNSGEVGRNLHTESFLYSGSRGCWFARIISVYRWPVAVSGSGHSAAMEALLHRMTPDERGCSRLLLAHVQELLLMIAFLFS